jgi:hypothetical protein
MALTKKELSKQLEAIGIHVVEGNFVKKSEVQKIVAKESDCFVVEISAKTVATTFVKALVKEFERGDWRYSASYVDDEMGDDFDVDTENIDEKEANKKFKLYLKDVQRHAQEAEGKLVLYRAISVENPEVWLNNLKKGYKSSFIEKATEDYSNRFVGQSWSYKKEGAIAYWGSKELQTIILEALVPLKDVMLDTTVAVAALYDPKEAEVQVEEGRNIVIRKIYIGKKVLDTNIKAKT